MREIERKSKLLWRHIICYKLHNIYINVNAFLSISVERETCIVLLSSIKVNKKYIIVKYKIYTFFDVDFKSYKSHFIIEPFWITFFSFHFIILHLLNIHIHCLFYLPYASNPPASRQSMFHPILQFCWKPKRLNRFLFLHFQIDFSRCMLQNYLVLTNSEIKD
jgi:hypothetical protein